MFYINVKEIKNNVPLTEKDIYEMAYYVLQTFDRYNEVIVNGLESAEEKFCEDENDLVYTKQFDMGNRESIEYVQSTNLLKELKDMWDFIYSDTACKSFHRRENGNIVLGMEFFAAETLSPLLSYDSLAVNGVMETGYHSEKIHALIIHYFALIKLEFGSLHQIENVDYSWGQLNSLGIDYERFSFRELTLLSGYKTERAIRNLASPSTPEHKRIKVTKKGRNTFIDHKEVKRWLTSNGRRAS